MRRRRTGHQISGSVVLITGAGSGIGRLMALEATRRGAQRLILWDRDEATVAAVAAEIEALGVEVLVQHVDVTDAAAVVSAARAAGDVDVVINNAGVVTGLPLLDATEAGIRRTFEVNTLALYWVTRAFLPGMIERNHGTIVTVASAAGLVGVARQTDYSASKHAAVGFDESLRAELRAMGSAVSTLVVCPFYISTGMFDGVQTRIPALLPILKPDDVATAILDALEAGRRRLVMPRGVGLLAPARVLPVAAFDRLLDALGVNRTMDGFTGRVR
ncbi:MAG: SDR family oxidoreductase [Micrococcus sp.]|nr:SDR family oxidoreductase [Micrococcus sp.]